jgi:hypothetical protein
MFRKLTMACVTALGLGTTAAPADASGVDIRFGIGFGRPNVVVRHDHDHGHGRWQEERFESRNRAFRFADRLRDRGYEVRVNRHGDHWHVEYRQRFFR